MWTSNISHSFVHFSSRRQLQHRSRLVGRNNRETLHGAMAPSIGVFRYTVQDYSSCHVTFSRTSSYYRTTCTTTIQRGSHSFSSRLHYLTTAMGQIWSTCSPTTLPDEIFKHWVPLNMKSSGNSKNIGLHYPVVGPQPRNAKFSNVLLRRRISKVRVNLVICISLGLLYIFCGFWGDRL